MLSAFPVAVVLAWDFATLAVAFVIGGLRWHITPALPFWIAGTIGLTGVVVFAATVEERYAG